MHSKPLVLLHFCVCGRTSRPHLSATARSLSGLKVPSVSMYMALPSPPPWSMGNWKEKTYRKVTLVYAFMQPVRWAYFFRRMFELLALNSTQCTRNGVEQRHSQQQPPLTTGPHSLMDVINRRYYQSHHWSALGEGPWKRMYLTSDCQGVAQLCLPCSELSKHLCDRASLNPTWQGERSQRGHNQGQTNAQLYWHCGAALANP